jgi:hypothetical protein
MRSGSYTGFPENTTNIKVVSSTELQMTMDKPFLPQSPTLSITPESWYFVK